MATVTRARRRRRRPRRSRLVERDWELATLEQCMHVATNGSGSVSFIEAGAGAGKSRLLAAAADIARSSRLRILGAVGTALERDFPFGLALQLFEPLWLSASPELRAELLRGAARAAAPLLGDKHVASSIAHEERRYAVIHGLFWATQNLVDSSARGAGVAVLIDDLQWSDALSLRFLAYLAERLDELPVAIVLAARPGEPSADEDSLQTVRRAARGGVIVPTALSEEGAQELVRAQFPAAAPEFCASCARVSGGNPFLLTELLAALAVQEPAPTAENAGLPAELLPDAVRNSVAARVESMPTITRTVAQAVAVLGDSATVRRVARVAELDPELVLAAADELVAMSMLAPGIPPSFAAPLLATAVRASLPPFEQAQAHLRAARVLAEQHAGSERIAEHLLHAPADEDPAAVAALRDAAAATLQRGEPARAARLLERALAEHPEGGVKVELLAALAEAEGQAGRPEACAHLAEAWRISDVPERRDELALAHGQALYRAGRFREAAEAMQLALADRRFGPTKLAGELRAVHIAAASVVRELGTAALEDRDELIDAGSLELTPLARAAIAHSCILDGLRGTPRDRLVELAELAWGEGALLDSCAELPLGVPLLAAALVMVDELERAIEICDAALDGAADGPRPAREEIHSARAWALYEQGRVSEARAAARTALEGAPRALGGFVQSSLAVIACCELELGDVERAESAVISLERLSERESLRRALMLGVRAQVRLAERRPEAALRDALDAGSLLDSRFPSASPASLSWRSTAALAHLALGETAPARKLITAELRHARTIGATRIAIRDLRILGLALNADEGGIESLGQASAIGESYPDRLEYIRALIDQGAALRRANNRVKARGPLRKGLDLSHRNGAAALESYAHTELIAAGARPRRAAASGVDSLTISQLRVAELAATGLTNRQIADALFVTPKTVEFHLRQTYRKLDVSSRQELAEMLTAAS